MTVRDLPRLVIDGKTARADVRSAVTSLSLLLTMDGASTVDLTLSDPRRALVRSSQFTRAARLNLDGRLFDLVRVAQNGDDLSLTFEDALIADLRRLRGVLRRPANTPTDAFVRLLVPRAYAVAVERRLASAGLHRGGEEPTESSWEAVSRLADERDWRCFSDGRTLFVGSDDWLLKRATVLPVRERVGPVDRLDVEADPGKPANDGTLTVRLNRFAANRPGTVVKVAGRGAGDGLWLVREVARDRFDEWAEVTLTRRQPALPEPQPEPRDDGDGTNTATAASATAAELLAALAGTRVTNVEPPPTIRDVPPPFNGGHQRPVGGPVTSPFGPRGGRLHAGVDFGCPIGTPVRTSKAGTVTHVGFDARGYGNFVYIDHGGGEVTRYGHLSQIKVARGTQVGGTTVIGLSGNTGRSTGPHLHFEIRRNGNPVDPLRVLPARDVVSRSTSR